VREFRIEEIRRPVSEETVRRKYRKTMSGVCDTCGGIAPVLSIHIAPVSGWCVCEKCYTVPQEQAAT
jgi:hypothetical protein